MSPAWYDLVGYGGVLLIVVSYLLLQLKRLDSDGLTYSLLNAAGAALIIVSLFYAFNASAMVVENRGFTMPGAWSSA